MRGISINGTRVFDREGPNYQTYYHRVTLTDVSMFKMVHGMEVNWPGIMVLIRYQK
jgi:hypothetical protein